MLLWMHDWAVHGGQVEARLSNTETLHLAASVMVVSEHSAQEGNKGREAILQHNALLFIHLSEAVQLECHSVF